MNAPSEDAIIALKQWVVVHGKQGPLVDHVVLDKPFTAATAPAFLAALPPFRDVLAKAYNHRPANAHHRLVNAYAALKVPFLTDWERAELDVLARLASGGYDDPEAYATARDRAIWGDEELWFLVMFGGEDGAAKAAPLLLAQADAAEVAFPKAGTFDRWLATGALPEDAKAVLESRFTAATGPLETKPVKTAAKLDCQMGALLAGTFPRDVLVKSFTQYFGYCFHPGSPSNFREKHAYVVAHNLWVARGTPASTLAVVKASLGMFKPAHRKIRRVHVLDVEPVAEALAWFEQRARAA